MQNTSRLNVSVFLCLLLGILVEMLVLPLWFVFRSPVVSILFHIVAVIFFYVSLISFKNKVGRGEKHATLLMAFMLVVFFPILGLPLAIVCFYFVEMELKKERSRIFEEYQEHLDIDDNQDDNVKHYKSLLKDMRQEVSFEPFIDIIKGHNNEIKEKVIEKLSRRLMPDSVQILKLALNDISPGIRLSAAGALLKMEDTINEKIQIVLTVTKERGLAKDFADLGDLYVMYANMGLMERKSFEYYLNLGCESYQKALNLDSNQKEVVISYVKSLLSIFSYEEAKEVLDKSMEAWKDDYDIVLLCAETNFYLNRINDVFDNLKSIDESKCNEDEKEIVGFWKS